MEVARLLDNIILNLRAADDAELIRWGNTLKYWKEPILNHFDNHTTFDATTSYVSPSVVITMAFKESTLYVAALIQPRSVIVSS